MRDKCPICRFDVPSWQFTPRPEGTTIHCSICGIFNVSEQFLTWSNLGMFDAHICSGALQEHNLKGTNYLLNNVDDLMHSVSIPNNPIEQIDKLLLSIEKYSGYFGEPRVLDCKIHFPYGYAKNAEEFHQLLLNAYQLTYLEYDGSFPQGRVKLLLRGAERIAELHKGDINSNQAFAAMWFDPMMNDLWTNGIEPALLATNYKAIRIDKTEHNKKIDDEIIAAIRKSGLVVADVTGHRPGVYYEAGFAMGLGIPVIWTCSEKDIEGAHFDTRQYSHVLWSDPEDLKSKLINRIEATQTKIAI
jgi:hypothetical protein